MLSPEMGVLPGGPGRAELWGRPVPPPAELTDFTAVSGKGGQHSEFFQGSHPLRFSFRKCYSRGRPTLWKPCTGCPTTTR